MTQTVNGDRADEMIRVEGLHKRYAPDRPEAVGEVDFVVARGEIFGLLGPNGAGKTTTIGTMTTRVKPTAGRVLVDGIDVRKDPVAVKQRIAVVPQMSNLDRTLTALENLTFHAAYFGAPRRERRKRALELLDRFGLGGRESEKVNKYSGGMAQRLMIARALMHQPKLLVLDEPTTGLDPQSRLFLWERIVELRELGTTLLLTTHDMLEADRLCDRIAIMDHGQVIANDTPRGLRRLLPAERGLELLLESPTDPVGRFELRAGVDRAGSNEVSNGRWQVRLYGDDDRLADAALAVTREPDGPILAELRRIEGTLEDVFVHLTGRDLR
ncbi:MAG TPA: ABC transporter ATP-binding protein [Solirubrobacteraceae bacterium]|nr:ABC transporter ATP-binding protein [Solirubrobacteraceae bacterium]